MLQVITNQESQQFVERIMEKVSQACRAAATIFQNFLQAMKYVLTLMVISLKPEVKPQEKLDETVTKLVFRVKSWQLISQISSKQCK